MKTASERRAEKMEKTQKRVGLLSKVIENLEKSKAQRVNLSEAMFNFLRPNMGMINQLELPNYVGNIYKAICVEFGGDLVVSREKLLYVVKNLPSFRKDIDSLHIEDGSEYGQQRAKVLDFRFSKE